MGDGRAEGSSAIADGGQAAISLTPDVDGMHVCIFESSQLEGSCVGDLLCPRNNTDQWYSMNVYYGFLKPGDNGK